MYDPFQITYDTSGFAARAPFPAEGTLDVTWQELVRAAIVVGRAPADLTRHGRFSTAEIAFRTLCFHAYFDSSEGKLAHSRAYEALDPTEQGVVSYFLGMTVTKLFAERCLHVPWLMHMSRYGARWAATYATASRPDLFGMDVHGGWTVAEAKFRKRLRAELATDIQAQKSSVASINGASPRYRVGAVARLLRRRVALRVIDPPAERDADHLTLDTAEWLASYYAPVVHLIEQVGVASRDGFVYGRLPDADVLVGLGREVHDLLVRRPEPGAERASPLRNRDVGRPPPSEERPFDPITAQTGQSQAGWLRELLDALLERGDSAAPDGVSVVLGDSWRRPR